MLAKETAKWIANQLALLAPVLKHDSFEEEKEWRLVSLPNKDQEPKLEFL